METTKESRQTFKVVAMILLVVGIALLAYGGYEYANDRGVVQGSAVTNTVTFGDNEVPLPIIGGILSLAAGAILLFLMREPVRNMPVTPHTRGT